MAAFIFVRSPEWYISSPFFIWENVRDMNKSCFLGDDVSILVIGK